MRSPRAENLMRAACRSCQPMWALPLPHLLGHPTASIVIIEREAHATNTIHLSLAYAAAAVTLVGIGWSISLWLRKGAGGPRYVQFQAAVTSLLIVASASGLVMLVSGARPADGLHLAYGIVAVALIPLARSLGGRGSGRRAALFMSSAFVVLGAIVYRLFTTG